MGFYKKILVLKPADQDFYPTERAMSGIIRVEGENDIFELHLSLINLHFSAGEYFLCFVDSSKKTFIFPLGARPVSLSKTFHTPPDLRSGFASGIFLVNQHIPSTLLFARTDNISLSLSQFKKIVADNCIENFKAQSDKLKRQNEIDNFLKTRSEYALKGSEDTDGENSTVTPTEAFTNEKNAIYNDEAVATENYYLNENQLKDKLDILKEKDNENLFYENEHANYKNQKEKNEGIKDACFTENETGTFSSQTNSGKRPYYFSVKKELDNIFHSFPREKKLERLIPCSIWAKIMYDDIKYYVVGLIKENDRQKYICYGVPATYSEDPPEKLKGFCSFLPESVFNLKGKGYWMMFQDALSGKCIHIKQ